MASDTLRLDLLDRPGLSSRIGAESRRSSTGPRFLDVVGMPFYVVGLLAFWTLVVAGGVARWCVAGVRLGWVEARRSAQGRGFDAQRWPVRPRAKR